MEYNDDGDLVPIDGVAVVVFMPNEETDGGKKRQNRADENTRRENAEFERMKTHGGKMAEAVGCANMRGKKRQNARMKTRGGKMTGSGGPGKSNNPLKNRATL